MTPPFSETLRRLIRESPDSLLKIARKANVPYGPLNRWMNGTTPGYNLLSAEAVYHALTGRTLAEAAGEGEAP